MCKADPRRDAYDPVACHNAHLELAYPEGNITNDPVNKNNKTKLSIVACRGKTEQLRERPYHFSFKVHSVNKLPNEK